MDNVTLQQQQPVQIRTPLPIIVIAWLLIIAGILSLLGSAFLLGLASFFFVGYGTTTSILFTLLMIALPGILAIVTGFGLRRLKKWSIYLLIIGVVWSLISVVVNLSDGVWSTELFITPAISVAVALYCWGKRDLFA